MSPAIDITSPEISKSVAWALGRAGVRFSDREDCRQYVMLKLWEAAGRYDPSRGASFRSFAAYRALGAARDYIRAEGVNFSRKEILFRQMVPLDEAHEIAGPDRPDERIQAARTIEGLMRVLDFRERYAICEHGLQERTLAEVGAGLGVCAARAQEIYQKAVLRMRLCSEGVAVKTSGRRIRKHVPVLAQAA